MEALGAISNATALFQQTFHLYRHVSASRSFADTAGSYSAMIIFEYFRFESWTQQSGLLTTDALGNPSISDDSIRLCLQRASRQTNGPLDIDRLESNILRSLGQLNQVLNKLDVLKTKYRIDTEDEVEEVGVGESGASLQDGKAQGTKVSNILPSGPSIAKAAQKAARSRQKRSSRVSFFRKVNFGWALTDDISDREKIASLIQELQYWNNALREMLPPSERKFADSVVSMRTLALSNDAGALANIGNAAHEVDGQLYNDIYAACDIKAKRLQQPPANPSNSVTTSIELARERIAKIEELSQVSKDPCRQLTSYFSEQSRSPESSTPILVEFTTFDERLSADECLILKSRIGQLCELLVRLDRPSTLLLPLSLGFLQYHRTQFALAYHLPEYADPHRDALSLYLIIRANKRSVPDMKSKQLWPTLEKRYQLASVLAEGLLSLLNVSWVHKALNSANIVLFHEIGSVHAVDFSRPQMMGFGVARPERPGEPTVDVRSLNSPWSLWQHPELRQGPHRRYERRFDIYSIGMILFEIGMWQDLHCFSAPQDSAFDFRQRVVNICHTKLAHHMGEAYKDAVLTCIEQDDHWLAAEAEEEASSAFLELFSWEVIRVLRRCCTGSDQEDSE